MFKVQKYNIILGHTPKFIKSVKESSSAPNLDVPLISRAIRPSKASTIDANTIKISAFSKLPSKASLNEFKPKHNPIMVIRLGRATLKSIFFVYRLNYSTS